MPRGAIAAVALTCLTATPASAGPAPSAVLTGPGSGHTTYLPPVAVTRAGDELLHVNADRDRHDVVASEHHAPVQCPAEPGVCPDGTPSWCLPPDPDAPWDERFNLLPYPAGECPLFWSPLIDPMQTAPVLGTEHLRAGESYPYYCTIHPWMNGTLVVLEEPPG